MANSESRSLLMDLPYELRAQVLTYVVVASTPSWAKLQLGMSSDCHFWFRRERYNLNPKITQVCRQLREEAYAAFWSYFCSRIAIEGCKTVPRFDTFSILRVKRLDVIFRYGGRSESHRHKRAEWQMEALATSLQRGVNLRHLNMVLYITTKLTEEEVTFLVKLFRAMNVFGSTSITFAKLSPTMPATQRAEIAARLANALKFSYAKEADSNMEIVSAVAPQP